MPRAALFALLAGSILCSGSAEAQRGVVFRGGAAPMGVDGHRGFRSGVFQSRPHVRHFHNSSSVLLAPFWYDNGFVDEEPYPEAVMNTPPPVVVVQTDNQPSPVPQSPAVAPKLIEVPGAATAAVSKPASPAIFILADGQRLESRRYVLTADELRVAIDRQQRTMVIPLSTLNLDATVAANRERGIELRIPTDRSEITLSF